MKDLFHDIVVVVAALTVKLSMFVLIFGAPMTLFLMSGASGN